MGASGHVALSADGIHIHYDVYGDGPAALVFVHGWCCDRSMWDRQVRRFSSRLTVAALDLAGHGASGRDREQWTMAAFGWDIAAVVEQLKPAPVVLVGHSMGGLAIVEAARLMPNRVRGVIGVDTWWDVEHERTAAEVDESLAPLRAHFSRAAGVVARRMFLPGSDAALVEEVATTVSATPPNVGVGALTESMLYDPREGLREIKAPKIVINADSFRPTNKASAARHGIEVIPIPGAVSHFFMREAPEIFNGLLREAVRKCFHPNADREPLKTVPEPTGKRTIFSFFASKAAAERTASASQAVATALGMAGPIAAGALIGHAELGMMAALGGLALSRDGKGATFRQRAKGLLYGLAAGTLAVFTGSALAGHGLTALGIPAVAAVAGLLGSISRPLARATTLFILYTIIASSIGARGVHASGATFLFFVGAAWTAGLSLGLKPLFRLLRFGRSRQPAETAVPAPSYTARQLLRRWKGTLGHLSGWQYILRITSCLVAAQSFELLWPHHHGYWVSITLVIVVQRDLQTAFERAVHRAVGTCLGVLLTGLFLLSEPSLWSMIGIIGILAAARPLLIDTNYTAYAAVMTPLVILLLDFGRDPSWAVVFDRLIATLVGCGIGLTLGYLAWSRIATPVTARIPVRNRRQPVAEAE